MGTTKISKKLLEQISYDDVLYAMKRWDEGIDINPSLRKNNKESKNYLLSYNGKTYNSKVIFAIAYENHYGKYINTTELTGGITSNGVATHLKNLRFEIVIKHEKGEFYSWSVLNENTMIKKGDKSFFEHKESGIPKEIKWFFDAEELNYGEKNDIKLIYLDNEYEGRIELDSLNRCRILWHVDLADCFKSYYHDDTDSYPLIRFEKIKTNCYEVEFLDDVIIEDEKDEPYESVLSQKEGKRKEYYVTKYERNSANRKRAIEIHGTKCMICGFDFEQVYGEAGRNFIEVHHVKALFEIGEEVEINPETDLVCICSNCHRIIHRRRDIVYSIEEVKAMIQSNNRIQNE